MNDCARPLKIGGNGTASEFCISAYCREPVPYHLPIFLTVTVQELKLEKPRRRRFVATVAGDVMQGCQDWGCQYSWYNTVQLYFFFTWPGFTIE
jgi:hypothetical protein